MSIRNMVYIALSLVSVAWAWSWGFQWMAGGSILQKLARLHEPRRQPRRAFCRASLAEILSLAA